MLIPSKDHVPGMLWCEFLASKLCLIKWTKTNSVWLHDCVVICVCYRLNSSSTVLWIWWGVCLPSRLRRTSVTSLTWWVLACFPQQTHMQHTSERYDDLKKKKGKTGWKTVLLFLWTVQFVTIAEVTAIVVLKPWFSEITLLLPACILMWFEVDTKMIVSCRMNEKYCSFKPMMNATFFPFWALVV